MLWLAPLLLPDGLVLSEPVLLPDELGPQSLIALREPPASPLIVWLLLLLLLSRDELLLDVPALGLELGLFIAELLLGPQSLRFDREPPSPDIVPEVPPVVAPLVALGVELVPLVPLLVCASAAVPRLSAKIDAPVRMRRFIRFLRIG